MEIFIELVSDYTLRTVALGSCVLGLVSGVLGSLVVLRRQSLLGDVMSHAALPGIALAFLLTGTKSPLLLLIGAALSGWIATFLILIVVNNSRIKFDGALAMGLSVFFGLGIVLLTVIQQRSDASQAGLETYLFGQAAALTEYDVKIMSIAGGIAITALLLFWKEFKISTFDSEFASSIGFNVRGIDVFITSLVVIAIVIGLQTVGVVLMSSMIVAPGVAARQWTNRLSTMVVLSGIIGVFSGLSGTVASSQVPRLPTGPAIVIVVSTVVFISILFSPVHGVLYQWFRDRKNASAVRQDVLLEGLYSLAISHDDPYYPHNTNVLGIMYSGFGNVETSLRKLKEKELVKEVSKDLWSLTDKGVREIENRFNVK